MKDKCFSHKYMTTLGVDFKVKDLIIDSKRIKFQIWDTAGQERFRNITNSYYRGAHGIIIVFDVTNLASFETITAWIKEISIKASQNSLKIIIANKTDMKNLRVVSEEQARNLCREFDMNYFETSAKDDQGVNEAFEFMAHKILSNIIENDNKKDEKGSDKKKKINGLAKLSFKEQIKVCSCCKI